MTTVPAVVPVPGIAPLPAGGPPGAFVVALDGGIRLGGGTVRLGARIGVDALVLRGGIERGPIDLTAMFAELLGAAYLQVPPDFPRVLLLSAEVEVDPGRMLAFEARSRVAWEKPFGAMTGVALLDLALSLHNDASGTRVSFGAGVVLGNLTAVEGALHFDGGRLVVAAVTVAEPLRLEDFLSWSVPGTSWGDLLPVTLGPASEGRPMRLYYATAAWGAWAAGFNIDNARIEVLGYGANLSLQVDGGVVLGGSLSTPIDLGFLLLSHPADPAASPVLSAGSRQGARWFSLEAGVTFLQERCATATVAVRRAAASSEYQLAATITYEGTIGPFDHPTMEFTWSRARGFDVRAWAIPEFPGAEYVDLATTLNKLSGGGCAVFVKEMFNEAVTTSFDFTASMDAPPPSDTAEEATLSVTASGTFVVKLIGREEPIITVPLPADLHVRLTKPEELSFGGLAAALGEAIRDSAVDLLRQVVEDPARAATFFAAVAAPSALAQVLAMIVCRGWTPVPPVIPPPPPPPPPINPIPPIVGPPGWPPPPERKDAPGPVTAEAPRYVDGAVQVAFSPVPGATGYGANVWSPYTPPAIPPARVTGSSPLRVAVGEGWPAGVYGVSVQAVNAQGEGPWATHQIIRLGPATLDAFEQEGLELVLRCTAVDRATGYDWLVVLPSGAVESRPRTSQPSARVALPPGAPGGRYTAIVRATAGDAAIPAQWSPPAVCLVDPGRLPGWMVTLANDGGPGAGPVTAVVTVPPGGVAVPVAPGDSSLLSPLPLRAFLAWRTAEVPSVPTYRLALGQAVGVATSGGAVTLSYRAIEAGSLPPGFSATARRGLATGGDLPVWADEYPPGALAALLWPSLGGQTAVAVATLLVTVYTAPALPQVALVAALAPLAPDAAPLARALVGVRDLYADTAPVTPASVALAVVTAWPPAAGPLLPIVLAAGLTAAFAAVGEPVAVDVLAAALVGAYRPPPTVAGLTPLADALRGCGAGLNPAAAALAGAVPDASAEALAGAAKAAFLGPTPTVAEYAAALAAAGRTAQQATVLLARSYPRTPPDQLMQLLLTLFAPTVGTPLLLGWCLAVAGVAVGPGVARLRVAFPQATAVELAVAAKTAWPAPAVAARVTDLVAAGATATEAAAALGVAFPDLTVTQVAWVLVVHFGATAGDARSLAAALAAAGRLMPAVARAVIRLLPLLGALGLAAVLKSTYLGGPP